MQSIVSSFPLTTQFDQFTDVVPPESPGNPDRGWVPAVVHWLTRPVVLDLTRGQEDLQPNVEVEAGADEVVQHHHGPEVEWFVRGHQPRSKHTHWRWYQ